MELGQARRTRRTDGRAYSRDVMRKFVTRPARRRAAQQSQYSFSYNVTLLCSRMFGVLWYIGYRCVELLQLDSLIVIYVSCMSKLTL